MGPETETDQQAEDEAAAELDTAQIPDWETLPGLAAGRLIAAWLLVLCAMVFAMVVLGGVTRLTQSGLSMVDWRPLTGWLPPMGEAEWQAVFERYRQFPEYKELNYGMGLGEFKSIFWLEYAHRLWGRVIGLVFLLPLVFFALRGWIGRRLAPRLVVIFALGAGQGVLGWYMVQSGLVLEPDVSQYRLVAHLAAALLIHGYMFWVALSLLGVGGEGETRQAAGRRFALLITVWIALTIVSGGFVAGLDAGLIHNSFPLMEGAVFPTSLMAETPWYINFFENLTTVQFDHRILAEALILLVLVFWLTMRRDLTGRRRLLLDGLALIALVQLSLGIATLLLVVPIPLAATHQAGAFILFTLSLWLVRELSDG